MPNSTDLARVGDLLGKCRADPNRFNSVVLGRPAYWAGQVEVCRSVVEHPITLVPAGNAVGKSYVAAGLLHWFLICHPGCLVVATAPTQVQLEEVLWKEVERAYRGSRIPLGGRMLRSPLKIDLGRGWQALAYSTTRTERFSGHHASDLLALIDEASGVEPAIWEAIDSLNPSRLLCVGNPLRPDGPFYERCARAESGANPLAHLIRIPSTDSPDIRLTRSPRGMADATWLAKARNDYGEGSLWWLPHVLARFPDRSSDTLIPRAWLDRAGAVGHRPAGPRRLAIDLAEGGGGDRSVLLVRDDNGLLALEYSPTWDLAESARRAARLAREFGVEPARIAYDASGIGADFGNRLEARGLVGCRPYKGGFSGGKSFANLRSACGWALRQRLDPGRTTSPRTDSGVAPRSPFPALVRLGEGQPPPQEDEDRAQAPFSIRPDWLAQLRRELQAIKYMNVNEKQIALEPAEDLARVLGHSPDLASALMISFAYPN